MSEQLDKDLDEGFFMALAAVLYLIIERGTAAEFDIEEAYETALDLQSGKKLITVIADGDKMKVKIDENKD